MSSPVHIYYKKKDILILGKVVIQKLDDTTLTVKAQYSINFSRSNMTFCSSLHYNGCSSFYLLMLQKYINSNQRILKENNILCF